MADGIGNANGSNESIASRLIVDLSHASLGELVDWLRDSQELVVLLDRSALDDDAGVLPSEPLSDRLLEQPICLLLDRLRFLDIGPAEVADRVAGDPPIGLPDKSWPGAGGMGGFGGGFF